PVLMGNRFCSSVTSGRKLSAFIGHLWCTVLYRCSCTPLYRSVQAVLLSVTHKNGHPEVPAFVGVTPSLSHNYLEPPQENSTQRCSYQWLPEQLWDSNSTALISKAAPTNHTHPHPPPRPGPYPRA